ncbi:hypothetical protein PPACK8108_LOCUS23463 [Phakopsora pachyrhizi]|uniref:Uncharacterized protein n=1 Tax=Phakopsora pachyrhizi TaxID=170000 RepID=A0AAV0BPQ2_PHAPC|nr:hypothetical protein PPACK8108_LOCUS23463 [Phakopsora pachyrhizi]
MPSHSASQYLNYYNTHQKRLLLANVQSQKAPELKSPTAPDVDSEDDLLATGSDPISDGYSWIQGSLSVSTGSSDELEIEDLIFDIFTDRSDEEPNDTDIPSEGVRRSIRNQRHRVDHEDLGSSLDVSREESLQRLELSYLSIGYQGSSSSGFKAQNAGPSQYYRQSSSRLRTESAAVVSSFKPAKDPTNAKEAIELVKIFLKEFPNQYSDQEALKLFKQCGGWSLMFEVASLRVLNNESDEGDRRYSEKVRSMIWTEEEDRLVLKLVEKIRSRRLEKKEGDRDSIKETVVEDDSESFSSADPGLIEELKLRKSEQAIKNRIEFLDNYLKHSNLF